MASIAIIDDNAEQSTTLSIALNAHLENHGSSFKVLTNYPFRNINDYFGYVSENNVCLLILDERLNDQNFDGNGPISYKGNELVLELRKQLKDFPIFMITTYSEDNEILEKYNQFELIISRDIFIDEGDKYIPILIRAAQRYLDSNLRELYEFSNLTKEMATGNISSDKIEKFKALQVKLELPITGYDDRQSWLNSYEKHIAELENLKTKLLKIIQK